MGSWSIHWNDDFPEACRGGAVTIGNFDGVHRGHQALLTTLRQHADAIPGPAVALTFDPHPLQLLRPQQFQPVLTATHDRAALMQQAGADHAVVLRTTPDLLQLSARDFFERILRERLAARAVVSGFNFAFGKNREGTLETLSAMCREAGLDFAVVPPLLDGGRPIASSRVRDELVRGDVREAARLLGRPFVVRGVVAEGARRGRTIGFPTANLERVATLLPADGVYAVRARLDERTWLAAANLGPNPTFGENARKVEVHLIGFEGDLYGRTLSVEFVERLRDTRTFAGPAELIDQLRADVGRARQLLGADESG